MQFEKEIRILPPIPSSLDFHSIFERRNAGPIAAAADAAAGGARRRGGGRRRRERGSGALQEPRRDGAARRVAHGECADLAAGVVRSASSFLSLWGRVRRLTSSLPLLFLGSWMQKDRRVNPAYSRRSSMVYTVAPARKVRAALSVFFSHVFVSRVMWNVGLADSIRVWSNLRGFRLRSLLRLMVSGVRLVGFGRKYGQSCSFSCQIRLPGFLQHPDYTFSKSHCNIQ